MGEKLGADFADKLDNRARYSHLSIAASNVENLVEEVGNFKDEGLVLFDKVAVVELLGHCHKNCDDGGHFLDVIVFAREFKTGQTTCIVKHHHLAVEDGLDGSVAEIVGPQVVVEMKSSKLHIGIGQLHYEVDSLVLDREKMLRVRFLCNFGFQLAHSLLTQWFVHWLDRFNR